MRREIKLGLNKISSKSKFEIEAEPNWDSACVALIVRITRVFGKGKTVIFFIFIGDLS